MESAFKTDSQGDWAELKVGEVKDFGNDWRDEIGTDPIVDSTWTISPALTKTNPQSIGGITSVFFSGAADGLTYWVENAITTQAGRLLKDSFRLVGRAR